MKHFQTKRLSTEGGKSVQECVDRIMKKLLTRAVGSLYSYKGRKQKGKEQKLAFSPTNMCKVVKGIILLQFLFIEILQKCNSMAICRFLFPFIKQLKIFQSETVMTVLKIN